MLLWIGRFQIDFEINEKYPLRIAKPYIIDRFAIAKFIGHLKKSSSIKKEIFWCQFSIALIVFPIHFLEIEYLQLVAVQVLATLLNVLQRRQFVYNSFENSKKKKNYIYLHHRTNNNGKKLLFASRKNVKKKNSNKWIFEPTHIHTHSKVEKTKKWLVSVLCFHDEWSNTKTTSKAYRVPLCTYPIDIAVDPYKRIKKERKNSM